MLELINHASIKLNKESTYPPYNSNCLQLCHMQPQSAHPRSIAPLAPPSMSKSVAGIARLEPASCTRLASHWPTAETHPIWNERARPLDPHSQQLELGGRSKDRHEIDSLLARSSSLSCFFAWHRNRAIAERKTIREILPEL